MMQPLQCICSEQCRKQKASDCCSMKPIQCVHAHAVLQTRASHSLADANGCMLRVASVLRIDSAALNLQGRCASAISANHPKSISSAVPASHSKTISSAPMGDWHTHQWHFASTAGHAAIQACITAIAMRLSHLLLASPRQQLCPALWRHRWRHLEEGSLKVTHAHSTACALHEASRKHIQAVVSQAVRQGTSNGHAELHGSARAVLSL
jgi:hypothetical protein